LVVSEVVTIEKIVETDCATYHKMTTNNEVVEAN